MRLQLLLGVIFFCTLVFADGCFGQEVPKAFLLDEHSEIPCDDTLGRLDVFFSELRNNPNASGLVNISAPWQRKHRIAWRHAVIEGHARDRGFDTNRFRVVRSVSGDELTISFWMIPPGASEPELRNVDMTYSVPDSVKPFMAGYETTFGVAVICPAVDDAAIFARFLKENGNSRGNIVVRDTTTRKARVQGERILRKFRTKYGISRSRLRVFTETIRKRTNDDQVIVEYWLLP